MKKNNRKVVHGGRSYTWVSVLTLVSHELGFPGGKYKAGYLAHKVCELKGWPMTGAREVLKRYALELLDSGKRYVKSTKFVPRVGQYRRSPDVPRLGDPHPDYKKDDGFYKSRAWRELRLLALANCRVCQACGARPPDVVLHVDHVQPRYKAPHLALSLENLQVLCEDCNVGKGAWSNADFRSHFHSI